MAEEECDGPNDQQLRIFEAADAAWALLKGRLEPEECVAAVAVMLAFRSGEGLMNASAEAEMLAYVNRSVLQLAPIARARVSEFIKQGAH
jgi:hypothetical protein